MIYVSRSRFDLRYRVKELARGMSAPRQRDLVASIRLARHLWCTKYFWKPGIKSEVKEVPEAAQWPPIVAYCDADWVSSIRDYKSTSGYFLTWCGVGVDAGQPGLPALI